MKATQLVQQFVSKLLGNKVKTPVPGQYPAGVAIAKISVSGQAGVLLTDKLGVIRLHEHWRN
jgi:hypothetical protein